jgi:hypothetical protein
VGIALPSLRIHAGELHVPIFDGVLYPSRNNYPAASIALFERARGKVKVIADIDLMEHAHWPRFVADYRIGVEPGPGQVQPELF